MQEREWKIRKRAHLVCNFPWSEGQLSWECIWLLAVIYKDASVQG